MQLTFICDSSPECARFFAVVQNDMQRGMSFWTSSLLFLSFWTRFWARKNPSIECVSRSSETVASLILDLSYQCARFFTIVQNDKQRGMLLSFWTRFWARKNPYSEYGSGVVKMELTFICDSSPECARFFTIVQNDKQRGMLLSFWTRFWARKNPSIECVSRSSETVASLIHDSSH